MLIGVAHGLEMFRAWLQQLYPRKVEKDAENFPVYANIDLSDLGPPGR